MEAVFKMPDEWLYIEDGDDRFHERLIEVKKIQGLFKLNEQGLIAAREQSPRGGRISLRLPRQGSAFGSVYHRPD